MKRTTVWALALVLAGISIVSCDSTSSPPADNSPTDTTGKNGNGNPAASNLDATVSLVSPSADTTVNNETTSMTVRFKAVSKTGLDGTLEGKSATLNAGVFSYKTDLAIGVNKLKIKTSGSGKADSLTLTVTRLLGAPVVRATTGQPGQTDFTDSVTVQFLVADNAATDSIRYTTNGAAAKILTSDPLVASGYTKTIKGTTTFRAIGMRRNTLGVVYSDTTTITFLIGKTLGKPYFSTNKVDSFNTVHKIAIGGFGVGDTVRYTTDGGDPTRDSYIYSKTDSIFVQSSQTIIAKSFNGNNSSPACSTLIKLNALDPVFSVKSGTYTSQRQLSIKSASGVPVYYTTDGSVPTNQSLKAGDTLVIDSNATVKAIAILPGWNSSKVVSASYKFKVATPTLSFRTGNYDTTQILSITDSASGADIRYTVDGSAPTCGSTKYDADSLLKLDSNVTIKAIGCKTGWDSSAVAVGNFTFKVAKIIFSPDSGIYRSYQSVKLSTRSPGVTFFVTRDSTTPTWDAVTGTPLNASTQKKLPGDTLFIQKSQWLRVIAVRNGWANSIADSRRYIVEGDTLLVDDFEQNSLTNPIGTNWRFWACGYCTNTGIPNQMETIADPSISNWSKNAIGFRNGNINFSMPAGGSKRDADGRTGPSYAGYSVGVPSVAMGETYRISFWARWKPAVGSPSTVPLVTEIVWKGNDKQNGYYWDGFQRYVDTLGSTWRQFILDYSAFFHAGNAYNPTTSIDSTGTTPKSYWIISPPYGSGYIDSARMIDMGLSKFQGEVWHDGTWKPNWVWSVDHDHWIKDEITNFRWSIMQPNTDKAGLRALGHYDQSKAIIGTDTLVCGDCHQPVEPGYSSTLLNGFAALQGSLELDRIQLIRRPQVSGGVNPPATKTDTTTTK